MFTGIITATAKVRKAKKRRGGLAVEIGKPRGWDLREGASVNVDGICSTVVRMRRGAFEAEYMPETLRKTTAALFRPGITVNLEQAIRFGERLGGHLVQGHVEATGKVLAIRKQGNSRMLDISFPRECLPYIAYKGSICVNGVSLTVAEAERMRCSVALVSYTLRHTNLGLLKKGDRVNIETDILARYAEHIFKNRYAKKK